jgi:hypothetical protein
MNTRKPKPMPDKTNTDSDDLEFIPATPRDRANYNALLDEIRQWFLRMDMSHEHP